MKAYEMPLATPISLAKEDIMSISFTMVENVGTYAKFSSGTSVDPGFEGE